MEGQILISLGREFGSGGHKIAQELAKRLDIEYYDNNILESMFGKGSSLAREMEDYDERKPNPFLFRRVRGYSNSMEEILAEKEFDFIREKAKNGESFVVVGRCGEVVLRDFKQHMSFFVLGDMYDKILRVSDRCNLDKRDAIDLIQRMDRVRKKYHNRYSEIKWGDSRGYDLCINISRLGVEGSAEVLLDFINRRMEMNK